MGRKLKEMFFILKIFCTALFLCLKLYCKVYLKIRDSKLIRSNLVFILSLDPVFLFFIRIRNSSGLRMSGPHVTIDDLSIGAVRHRLAQCTRLLQTYEWLINSFVLDYFLGIYICTCHTVCLQYLPAVRRTQPIMKSSFRIDCIQIHKIYEYGSGSTSINSPN